MRAVDLAQLRLLAWRVRRRRALSRRTMDLLWYLDEIARHG